MVSGSGAGDLAHQRGNLVSPFQRLRHIAPPRGNPLEHLRERLRVRAGRVCSWDRCPCGQFPRVGGIFSVARAGVPSCPVVEMPDDHVAEPVTPEAVADEDRQERSELVEGRLDLFHFFAKPVQLFSFPTP